MNFPSQICSAWTSTTDEWREALRACKGMVLRQEIYELDVAKLEQDTQLPVKLFSAAQRNCDIRRLQPLGSNRHAVFLTLESEAITYHYEMDLRAGTARRSARLTHSQSPLRSLRSSAAVDRGRLPALRQHTTTRARA